MKKILLVIIGTCIAALSLFIFYKKVLMNTTEKFSVVFTVPTPTPDPLTPKNFLLLGYGGGTHDGAMLTDTMIVIHVVPKSKQIVFISIPRDLWVSLPLTQDGVMEKINAAYAYGFEKKKYPDRPTYYRGANGGGKLATYAVSQVIGMPIDSYVAISFEGFKNILKTMGPVSVNVPYTFEDLWYPIDGKEKDTCEKTPEEMQQIAATASGDVLEQAYTCRYETVKFEKGIQILDGDQALKFVRSRHSDTHPGDFYRSLRQQALIQGVIAKVKTIGGMMKLPVLLPQLAKMVTTDLTTSQAINAMRTYSDLLSYHISRISLTDDETILVSSISADGQYILIPANRNGYDGVKEYISDQITRLIATPSLAP